MQTILYLLICSCHLFCTSREYKSALDVPAPFGYPLLVKCPESRDLGADNGIMKISVEISLIFPIDPVQVTLN